MIRTLFLIALLLVGILSFAQELPKIIPPSPNAASLGKYGQVPVGLFTGTPQINIPLYTLKTGKLSVPVSLDYSSNGIRVDEIASNVGLGWSLHAGGVITRVIMDDADESLTVPIPNNFPSAYTQEVLNYLINATNSEDGGDTLSDIYSFNINGFSGKFYLDTNRTPVLINPSPVKIEKGTTSGYAFKITDPNGIIYWFGNQNSTEETSYQHVGSGQHGWSLENPNSWYLSKIVNTQGDEINFAYTNFNQEYYSGVSQSVEKETQTGGIYGPGQGLIQTRSMTSIAQLSTITSSTGQINFTYSASTNEFNKLDVIEVKDTNGTLIKKFTLGYDDVVSSLQTLKNNHIPYSDDYGKRLFLSSVTEYGKGTVSKPPYTLSYYSPDKIPPRFSYAQDYWGYYNGVTNNNYLVSNEDYFFYEEANTIILKNMFKSIGGNKKPNGNYSRNGMLKKITYPTGGFNELMYEPHSYLGTKITYPPKTSMPLNIKNNADQFDTIKTDTTEVISFLQKGVPVGLTTRKNSCWEPNWPTHHIRASLSVKVANQGSTTFNTPTSGEGFFSVDQHGNRIDHSGGLAANEDTVAAYFIDLQAGKRYQFTLKVNFECVGGDFYIEYYPGQPNEVPANIEIGGQRLQRTITDDGKGKQEIKKYHYGELSDMNSSSGIAEKPIPSISYNKRFEFSQGDLVMTEHHVDVLTLSSSTLHNLYSRAGHQIGYTSVIEELGDNFSGGGTVHKFRVTPNSGPFPFGLSIAGTPFNTNFGTGEEIENQVLRKAGNSFTVLQKTTNAYYNNPVLNKEQPSYNVRLRDTYNLGFGQSIEGDILCYDVVKYFVKSEWRYLNKTITEHYDQNGENPVTTTTDYFYDNPDHLQVTRTETTTSENRKATSKTIYPQDVEIKTPVIEKLISQHRIGEPIQQETIIKKSDGTVLSKNVQRTHYKDWGNNIILPDFVKTLKGDLNLANPFNNRIQFYNYDHKGNPLEVSKADGSHIVYIWGYQDMYPIAKIENATYTEVGSYVTDLKTKSNADIDHCKEATCKEQVLRVALQNLREALPNAMVSTYTYDPLIGVTSMTDPQGETVYYHYDEMNRMQYALDNDQHIAQQVRYNYHGQQTDALGDVTIDLPGSEPTQPNQAVTFTANTSGSGGADLYTWSVGGTQEQCDSTTSFTTTFTSEGTYTVTVLAYNSQTKHRVSTTINVVVAYPPINVPTISANYTHIVKGTNVSFSASGIGGGTGNLRYEWYVNNVKQAGTATTFTYNPGTAGTYNVYFKVIDTTSGKTMNSAIRQLHAYNPLNTPTISASKAHIVQGTTTTFTASGIGGGSGSRSYEWYINDVKQSATGTTYSYHFPNSGTYTIKFKVVDLTLQNANYKWGANNPVLKSYPGMVASTSQSHTSISGANPSVSFNITSLTNGSGSRQISWKAYKTVSPSQILGSGSSTSFSFSNFATGTHEYDVKATVTDNLTGQVITKLMVVVATVSTDTGGGNTGEQH